MVMDKRDGSLGAANVSNDTPPCTMQTTSYPASLETGLRCRLWDTRGLDEAVGTSDRSLIARMLDKIRELASNQTRELRETLRDRTRQGVPILVWCIDAAKIEVPVYWQQFSKVYVEYCERRATPAVVITRGPPKGAEWEAKWTRCTEQLQGLGLGVEVPFRMVGKYRNPSAPGSEYEEDSKALRDFISELMGH